MYTPPFNITDEILQLVADISERMGRIEALSESQMPEPMLRKENRIKTIHSSLAIEHNSLSLQQVTDIINGKHVLGAPNEIQEVKNAIDAYHLMLQLDAFKEKDLLRAHAAMMHDLVDKAGRYRQDGVGVFDDNGHCIHMAPPAGRVPYLMSDLFEWVSTTKTHPLISSCVFHYEFEFIHPFIDGNGRMGRFWQTMLLSRWKPVFAWLPVETLVRENQQGYYSAIAQSDREAQSAPFITFMLDCLLQVVKNHEVTNKVANKVTNKSELQILELLKANNRLTIAELCQQTGLSQSGVKRILAALKAAGLLLRHGSNKAGYWEARG